jgi:hypothetical protein
MHLPGLPGTSYWHPVLQVLAAVVPLSSVLASRELVRAAQCN